MQTCFQPFESHLPYYLQFKTDFNLFGMQYVHVEGALFRAGLPSQRHQRRWKGWDRPVLAVEAVDGDTLSPAEHATGDREPKPWTWLDRNTPLDWRWDEFNGPARHSTCEIEVDVAGENILNREELDELRVPLKVVVGTTDDDAPVYRKLCLPRLSKPPPVYAPRLLLTTVDGAPPGRHRMWTTTRVWSAPWRPCGPRSSPASWLLKTTVAA
jgi:hypothetical protein